MAHTVVMDRNIVGLYGSPNLMATVTEILFTHNHGMTNMALGPYLAIFTMEDAILK